MTCCWKGISGFMSSNFAVSVLCGPQGKQPDRDFRVKLEGCIRTGWMSSGGHVSWWAVSVLLLRSHIFPDYVSSAQSESKQSLSLFSHSTDFTSDVRGLYHNSRSRNDFICPYRSNGALNVRNYSLSWHVSSSVSSFSPLSSCFLCLLW